MSDLESYVSHCYDLMLKQNPQQKEAAADDEHLACVRLIEHQEKED